MYKIVYYSERIINHKEYLTTKPSRDGGTRRTQRRRKVRELPFAALLPLCPSWFIILSL